MKYNNNVETNIKNKVTAVKVIAILLIVLVGIAIAIWLIPLAGRAAENINLNGLIACITLWITLCTIIIKICENILRHSYEAKRRISLETKPTSEGVIISCAIENYGPKRIIPQNILLFVEEGLEKNGLYTFPYLLKHEQGKLDCALSTYCKQSRVACIPEHLIDEEFKPLYRRVIELKHLSSQTIMFIDPGELFSEDVVLKLKKGAYRATAIWTSVNEDCICATKQFVVETSTIPASKKKTVVESK